MVKEQVGFESDPHSLFIFAINSPLLKKKYVSTALADQVMNVNKVIEILRSKRLMIIYKAYGRSDK